MRFLFFRIWSLFVGHRPLNRTRRAGWNHLYEAKVLKVFDGDTVMVLKAGYQVCIRLDAIDCPEGTQPWGNIAKAGLIKLIGGRDVFLDIHGTDIYGRTLATIYVRQHSKLVNVNEKMVVLGHAWVMRAYYQHLPERRRAQLNRLERWAKSKRVGLWRHDNPIEPWKWRKQDSA